MKRAEDGAVHTLEVTVAVMVLVTSVGFYAAMDVPAYSSSVIPDMYQDGLRNFVAVQNDLPLPSTVCSGSSALENFLLQGLAGEENEWKAAVRRRFGEHVEGDLTLRNGEGNLPLTTPFPRPAIAGVKTLYRPNWSYVMPLAQSDVVSGREPFIVDIYPVKGTHLIKPQGEAIEAQLTIDGLLQDPVLRATGLTGAPSIEVESDALTREFAQNITWVTTADAPSLIRGLTAREIAPNATALSFKLRVEPGLNGEELDTWSMPEGLRVTVSLPADWDPDFGELVGQNPAWLVASSGSVEQGWSLTFELRERSAELERITLVTRVPSEAARPFDLLHASLGGGSLGRSSLAVVYPVSVEDALPLAAHMTVPYPVRNGTRAIFGVVLVNGGDEVAVTQVELSIPGAYDLGMDRPRHGGRGAPLFVPGSDVLVPDATEPLGWRVEPAWQVVSEKRIVWTGPASVAQGGARDWVVSLLIEEHPSAGTSTEPSWSEGVVSTLTFPNGFTHASTTWATTPGVIRHVVPPETAAGGDGYPWRLPVGGEPAVVFEYGVRVDGGGVVLSNTSAYRVQALAGDPVRTQRAIEDSELRISAPFQPVGSLVQVDADITSLASELSAAGVGSARFTASFYPPSSLGCSPTAQWSADIETLPVSAIRAVRVWDPLGDGVGVVYLTGDDKQVYALDASGRALWSHRLAAGGLTLTSARFGPLDGGLFVGDAGARLTRLNPVMGTVVWSHAVPATPTHVGPDGVVSVAIDEASGRVIVSTVGGAIETLRAADGLVLARHEGPGGTRRASLGITPMGDILAVNTSATSERLERLDPTLTIVAASAFGTNVAGYAQAAVGILAASTGSSIVLDATSLQPDPLFAIHAYPTPIESWSAGDATGDGVPDLAVSVEGLVVYLRDGATGEQAWMHTVTGDPPGSRVKGGDGFGSRHAPECSTWSDDFAGYALPDVCVPSFPQHGEPQAIRAGDGAVRFAYARSGLHELVSIVNGDIEWLERFDDAETALALHQGPWLAGETFALATSEGTLRLHDAHAGTILLDTKPTGFAGAFRIQLPLPIGSFYGTHLLVGSLAWTDSAGFAQEARLHTRFEAFRANGTAPPRASYEIIARMEDRSDPLGGP